MRKHLALLMVIGVMFYGCESKESTQTKNVKKETKSVNEVVSEVSKKTKEVASKVSDKAEEATDKVAEKTKETVKEVANKVADKAEEATEKVVEKTKETVKEVADKTEQVAEKVASSDNIQAGKKFYKPCIACHGKNAEKKALGKSQIIAKWSKEQIIEAMEGYKSKTYGGAMKTMMYPQASKLKKEEIVQLADYIVSLKK